MMLQPHQEQRIRVNSIGIKTRTARRSEVQHQAKGCSTDASSFLELYFVNIGSSADLPIILQLQ